MAVGIILADLGLRAYSAFSPKLADFDLSTMAAAASSVITKPTDGTSISGLKRTVLYSASEEEDLINAAALALPSRLVKDVTAVAYLVRNTENGQIVAGQNPDKLVPIASLTKLVTAAVADRLIEDDKTIKISGEVMKIYGNTGQFKVGETVRARDLYFPLLMVSSNDAAESLARSYGRRQFIQAMNDFVQSIGAYRTTFVDPSGLSADNRSTVNDLAMILEWIRLNKPEIMEITKLKTKTVRTHTWVNPSHFLSWSNYEGGKNGYTDEANRTAVALFAMGKEKIIYEIIILGSKVRDADMVKLLAKIKS